MLWLVPWALLAGWAMAAGGPTLCMESLNTVLGEFTFYDGDPAADYYSQFCTNTLGVHSLWLAASLYCIGDEFIAGTALAVSYCAGDNLTLTPYSAVEKDFTDEYINSLKVVYFDDINETKIWNESVYVSKQLYEEGKRTTYVFDEAYVIHQRYGWSVYGFWGGLLALGIANRFLGFLFGRRVTQRHQDIETISATQKPYAISRFPHIEAARSWFRTNLVIPVVWGSKHQQLVWTCQIPTRLEFVVIVSYWIISIILISVSYEVFEHNLYYSYSSQIWRYFSDRTGIICYANLPVLWIFSGRNNIFLWATGWSFSTFNTFHRAIARIAVFQAIIHSVGWSVLEGHEGYFIEEWGEQYWYMGAMATVAMSLLLVFSSIYLRQRAYEMFLLIHIGLSIVTIVGLFYHTKIFDGEYDPYLWPLVAIWCFDRFMRIVKLLYCNLHIRFSGKPLTTKITAIYDQVSDMIRLEVVPGSKILTPKPNQHYYLYQWQSWKGWENHPFTLAGLTSPDTSSNVVLSEAAQKSSITEINSKGQTSVAQEQASSQSSESESSGSSEEVSKHESSSEQKLIFLIRPSSGWTRRLRDDCLKQPSTPLVTPMLIEGPYGHSAPLNRYGNILFITGGTGIAGATSYLQEHFSNLASGSTATYTNIGLIWACKQESMIRGIAGKELAQVIRSNDIKTSFFVTSQSLPLKEMDSKFISGSANVEIKFGRPDIKASVLSFVDEAYASGSKGKTAILVCGPGAMADAARSAVHMALKNGRKGVDYYEETFGW